MKKLIFLNLFFVTIQSVFCMDYPDFPVLVSTDLLTFISRDLHNEEYIKSLETALIKQEWCGDAILSLQGNVVLAANTNVLGGLGLPQIYLQTCVLDQNIHQPADIFFDSENHLRDVPMIEAPSLESGVSSDGCDTVRNVEIISFRRPTMVKFSEDFEFLGIFYLESEYWGKLGVCEYISDSVEIILCLLLKNLCKNNSVEVKTCVIKNLLSKVSILGDVWSEFNSVEKHSLAVAYGFDAEALDGFWFWFKKDLGCSVC